MAEPDTNLKLVIAITHMGKPPSSTLSILDPRSGVVSEVYRDTKEGERILAKIGGSDLLDVARAMPPNEVYAFIGPPTAESNKATDTLSCLSLPGASWKAVNQIPLSFSEASPYGMWNRAPLLAVSPNRQHFAITALRIGEKALAGPAIRVITMYDAEEWQIPLPSKEFQVNDMAWSPDGTHLAYALIPLGDEHTLDESLLPQAGVYLADLSAHTSALLHHCYPAALAWTPRGDRISVTVSPDIWSSANVVRTLAYPNALRVEEFSVAGSAEAICYSDDGQWLAIQVIGDGTHTVQLRPTTGGWPQTIYQLSASDGRLALLGWIRMRD